MVSDDNDRFVALMSAANEAEAAMVVAALECQGVSAHPEGGLTAGFRAEAPGHVRIVVKKSQLEQARAVLDDIRHQRGG